MNQHELFAHLSPLSVLVCVDRTDGAIIQELLTFKIERGHDDYIKKLPDDDGITAKDIFDGGFARVILCGELIILVRVYCVLPQIQMKPVHDFIEIQRLADMAVHAGGEAFFDVFLKYVSGHCNYRNLLIKIFIAAVICRRSGI